MKKLLFITTRLFWPMDSGRKVSLYHYCRGLHEKYGYDIYIYSFLENYENAKIENKPSFIKEVVLANEVSKVTVLRNLFVKSFCFGWPFQNSLMYSKKNEKAIAKYVDKIQPDLIMVDMVRLAPYYKAFQNFNCMKVLDMDDLLSKRYESQIETKKQKGNIMGSFSKSNSFVSKMLNNSFLKSLILKMEKRRIYKTEIKYGKIYDKVIFVSDNETNLYNSRVEKKNGYTVRLGVDYQFLSKSINVEKKDGYIGFLGNLNYAPNVDSLDLLITKILPKLNYNYHLSIIGKVPDEIKNKYSNEQIEFKGMVDDFRPFLKECELFVAPITFGSGVKTKVLEAMALEIPVITNKLGAEGIDAINNQDFFVRNTVEQMVEIIEYVHNNKCLDVAASGNKLIKDKYDWNTIFDSFESVLESGIEK